MGADHRAVRARGLARGRGRVRALEDAPLRVTERGETREGVVEEVAEFQRIVFRWGDSRVQWTLEDHPDGTRFVVTEHRYAADTITWGPKLSALSATSMLCPA